MSAEVDEIFMPSAFNIARGVMAAGLGRMSRCDWWRDDRDVEMGVGVEAVRRGPRPEKSVETNV